MTEKKIIFPLIGSIINVQAYKYDETLYRQWNGVKVLRNTDEHYLLFMYKTKVAEANKNGWVYREPVLWFMPKNSFYNALILLKPKSNYVYINLASRPFYEDNTIKFVDFDIDIKKYPQKDIMVVDRDEFVTNAKTMKYTDEIKHSIYKEIEKILQMYDNDMYFFDNKVIDYYINLAKKDHSLRNDFRNELKFKKNYKKVQKVNKSTRYNKKVGE